jgi:hypothetical protein
MPRPKDARDLHAALSAVAGDVLRGVSVPSLDDRSTWRMDYASPPSADIKAAVDGVVSAWSFSGMIEDAPAAVDDSADLRAQLAEQTRRLDALLTSIANAR